MKKERYFDVIKRPLLTEKSSALTANGQESHVFKVKFNSTKAEIKEAVEALFDVKVESVNSVIVGGKLKRVGRNFGRRSTWKKAYIKLKEGSKINLVEGV